MKRSFERKSNKKKCPRCKQFACVFSGCVRVKTPKELEEAEIAKQELYDAVRKEAIKCLSPIYP